MTRGPVKLGLGTVQFGQAYGISNKRGQVAKEDVRAILERAAAGGIRTLDTAAGYGEAEKVLGDFARFTKSFRLVTKTIGSNNGVDAVLARARRSALLLDRQPIDLLLVHAAGDLLGPEGPALWDALLGLRDQGLFRGIGISAYVDDDPVALARRFHPAAMQVPLSILDQRLIATGALATLKDLGVEIHVRSLFLQGLLFLPRDELSPKLRHAHPHLEAVRHKLSQAGLTPLEGAVAFANAQTAIDVALVGVTALSELDEILAAAAKPPPALEWKTLALDDALVLTPSRW